MIDDEGIAKEFLEEAKEHLSGIESDLLAIEEGGADADTELINDVFRAIHSIKGGAGFLGYDKIQALAHSQENLLNKLRSKELVPTSEIMNVLLTTIDLLEQMIDQASSSEEVDINQALQDLHRVAEEEGSLISAPLPTYDIDSLLASTPNELFEMEASAGSHIYAVELDVQKDLHPRDKTVESFFRECWDTGNIINSSVDISAIMERHISDDALPKCIAFIYSTVLEPTLIDTMIPVPEERRRHISVEELTKQAEPPPEKPKESSGAASKSSDPISTSAPPPPSNKAPGKKASQTDSSIRVNIKTLDCLMSLTSELVLARNALTKKIQDEEAQGLGGLAQRLDGITSKLQLAVMSTRMQPIGKVFGKFKRVVRDLSQQLSKQVDLELIGEGVELDKTIIETIGDPLTHLVRNAVDHGIEGPEDRQAAGKKPMGTLCLKAYHEAGQVIIEIIDDGKGIDTQKVKQKALSGGHFEAEHIESLSDKELQRLIFKPGFSMAKEVTEISGRGVGMDVVYTNFSKLGGVVDIDSVLGKGTTIQIKLPLTLAIIPSLLVTVEEEVFAIPQANLIELVSIPPNKISESIHEIAGYRVLRLRDKLLPLVELASLLEISSNANTETPSEGKGRHDSCLNVVVVASGNCRYGLVVSQFLDSEEIVVKPLDNFLSDCSCYAGATIQGNGMVALILDILGISERANLASSEQTLEKLKQEQHSSDSNDPQNILIFDNGTSEQFAVPFSVLSRIERVPTSSLQVISGRMNINYRGGTLPLISVEEVANVSPRTEEDHINILVFSVSNRELGLIANNIRDVHTVTTIIDEMTFQQPGILGSVVIDDKATLIVDVYGMVGVLYPSWLDEMKYHGKSESQPKVLLVEDSNFYRKHISTFLTENGCDVTAAKDGLEGLQALEDPEQNFSLVFTDIEMPNMNGLEMTQKIRSETRFNSLPIVAVTSLTGTEAEKTGLEAGVNEYLVKLNKEDIARCLQKYL